MSDLAYQDLKNLTLNQKMEMFGTLVNKGQSSLNSLSESLFSQSQVKSDNLDEESKAYGSLRKNSYNNY